MFRNNLKVELDNNRDKCAIVIEDLHYEYKSEVITVPAGFKTDFASVPRIPIIFEVVGDRGMAAATVHDWLYQTGAMGRKESDKVLLQALRDTKVGKFRSYLMYFGVRGFGWMFYKK